MKTTFDEPNENEPKKNLAPAIWINGSSTANLDFTTPKVIRTGTQYDPTETLGYMNDALIEYLKKAGEL